MTLPLTRRSFIRSSAAAAGATFLSPNLLFPQAKGASEKLNIACIGAMGKGRSDRGAIQGSETIVAICDVDSDNLAKAAKDSPGAKLYSDFRQMFDEMADRIDAVIVSTPDHAHFPVAMAAIDAGKHICVQKPLCNRIWEVRELHKAAQEKGIITQMGNQGRTKEGQRLVKEWIAQGAIGKLKEIKLWTNRPIWPQGPGVTRISAKPPANLNWELWQAQIPEMPYAESIHPFKWRGWWDYGSGALGDMGCHIMDASFSVLDAAIPTKIDVESGDCSDEIAPGWSSLVYHFEDGRTVSWDDGNRDGKMNRPERPDALSSISPEAWQKASSGMLFVGEEGVIFSSDAYCSSARVYPPERMEDLKKMIKSGKILKTEKRSTHPGEPQKEWVHAIKNDLATSSNFDYSAPLTEFVLLGNLAIRAGKSVSWNKKKMSTGDPEADRFIGRPDYREGWVYQEARKGSTDSHP